MFENCLDFISKQKDWAFKEFQTEQVQISSQLDNLILEDLQKKGLAIINLKFKSLSHGIGACLVCKLLIQNSIETPISQGDCVQVVNQVNGILVKNNVILKGVIQKKNQEMVVIMVDSKYKEISIDDFENKRLSIIIAGNEITYKRRILALDNLKSSYEKQKKPAFYLIQQLLDQEEPHKEFFSNRQYHIEGLNHDQNQSVQSILNSNSNIKIIHGPPGTGKTTTVCKLIEVAVSQQNMKFLVSAGSNCAIDNIVERLGGKVKLCRIGHPARIHSSIKQYSINSLMKKQQAYKETKRLKQEISAQQKKLSKNPRDKEIKNQIKLLRKEMKEFQQQILRDIILDSDVVCGTCTGLMDKPVQKILENTLFDMAIIDECAQSIEVDCWMSMIYAKRVVIAGDHKQLPPTVKSNIKELNVTLMERILNELDKEGSMSHLLRIQYRMNSLIMQTINPIVYDNKLIAHDIVSNHQLKDLEISSDQLNDTVLYLINTSGSQIYEKEDDESKLNQGEAKLTAKMVQIMIEAGMKMDDIGVITPYRAQVQEIKKNLSLYFRELKTSTNNQLSQINTQLLDLDNPVEVHTVDGFQGREKEAIIISFVRSNLDKQIGFLEEWRRTNVAITRAKRFLCLIADVEMLESNQFLQKVFKNVQEHAKIVLPQQLVDENFSIKIKQEIKQVSQKKEGKKDKKKQNNQFKQNQNQNKNEYQDLKYNDFTEYKESKQAEDEIKQKKYQQIIEDFLKSENNQIKLTDLDSFSRKLLHEICETFDLIHESQETQKKNLKDMIIQKKIQIKPEQQQQQKQQNIFNSIQQIEVSEQELTNQDNPTFYLKQQYEAQQQQQNQKKIKQKQKKVKEEQHSNSKPEDDLDFLDRLIKEKEQEEMKKTGYEFRRFENEEPGYWERVKSEKLKDQLENKLKEQKEKRISKDVQKLKEKKK